MTTWTCKGLVSAFATCLALAGCDAMDGLKLGLPADTEPLRFAELAGGAVTLVPPAGYCVDPTSLKARFALMARCDALGGDSGQGAPLAVITATAVVPTTDAAVTTDDLVTDQETILARESTDTLTMVQVRGVPPIDDARPFYWRGAGRINGHVIGLTIYEAKGGIPLGQRAPALLVQTIERSRAEATAQEDNSATLDTNPG